MASVLVLDDQTANRELLAAVVGSAGHTVWQAERGDVALQLTREHAPDLIITDILMPVMDGYEFVRQLRSDSLISDTRVVFYTATYDENEIRDLGAGNGVEVVLLKPCAPEDILRVVAEVLAADAPAAAPVAIERADGEQLSVLNDKLIARLAELEALNQRYESANAALQRSERNLASSARFFNLTSDMACTASFGGRFAQLNDQWQQTLGWTADELRARPLTEFIHPDDRAATAVFDDRLRRGETNLEFRNRYRTNDGRWCWLEWAATGAVEEEMIYASARDVTARVEAEAILREAEAAAEAARDRALEASRMKSSFLANMSHEIRTPLSGVIGMAQLLLASPLDDQQIEYARLLQTSADTLVTVVNDILDFSKIEAGALRLENVDFDLASTLEDACDLLTEAAQQKGVSLSLKLDSEIPELVRGDVIRVRQVVFNLLSNAVKFTGEGEIQVTGRVIRSDADQVTVGCEVADTGIGIEPERLEQVFNAFTQADDSTTRRFGGSGLGLAIVAELVQMMGGEIGVDSTPGQGSRFRFTLALGHGTAEPAGPERSELTGRRLLVVDGDPDTEAAVARLAARWQMSVVGAHGGREALQQLRDAAAQEDPFECVVLATQLPDMPGLDCAQSILRADSFPAAPVVMLTATYGERRRARDHGFLATAKPIRRVPLRDALSEAMSVHTRQERELARAADAGLIPAILVAEDNEVNQVLAVTMLNRRGYRADVVGDGHQAVAVLADQGYAAVFMDCQMPGMSGYEATAEVRQREGSRRHTPIIAMTAHAMPGDREKCLASGMDDYLSKPLAPGELDRALRRWAPRTTISLARPAAPVLAPSDVADGALDPEGVQRLQHEFGAAALGRLIELFAIQTPELLGEMRRAIAAGDAKAVGTCAHKLRGGCSTLAATHTAALCRELEFRATDGSLGGAEALVGQIEASFRAAHAALLDEI